VSPRSNQLQLAIAISFGVLFSLVAPQTLSAGLTITPNTTLQAETGNNTSTANSFREQTNGNAGSGNVSKVPIRSLLYPGSNTKILVNLLAWFGPANHINVGYASDDPAQVRRQVQDMVSRGIQGVVIDWFGPERTVINNATYLFKKEAEARPGKFEFSVMEDVGAVVEAARATNCNVTDRIITDIQYIARNFIPSPAYTRINGRPVIFFFGVGAYYVDWARVRAAVGNDILFVFRGVGGLKQAASNGGFAWVDIPSDPYNMNLAAQESFYSAALSASGQVAIGSAYKGFNDTIAGWGTNRVIHQQCGQTWLATLRNIGKFYSSSRQLPALQLVTWNDYEEGSALENGVDNCVYVVANTSGNTLRWSIAGGGSNTIHHYTVFISTDGVNLMKLADIPSSARSYDLGALGLSPGTYVLYVKAVGQPGIRNKMSPAIRFRTSNEPPVVQLSVTSVDSRTITASTSGSRDPDGSLAASKIDFGDGFVANGPTATHTYARANSYDITATVFDNHGASSVSTKRVTVKPPSTGVRIFSPANGATLDSPVTFIATARASAPITAMRIYVDGKTQFTVREDHINTMLKVNTGTHNVTVQAWDVNGAVYRSSIQITSEPNNQYPAAHIAFSPLTSVSPLTMLACMAGSRDPDGFINGYAMSFSDGFSSFSPGVAHTFASAGTYTANAVVVDQFGLSDSRTATFTVGPGGSTPGVTVTSPPNGATVSSPVRFVASAVSSNPITAIAVYVDNQRVLLRNASSIDESVALTSGAHFVVVQAWDSTGSIFKRSLNITVQ